MRFPEPTFVGRCLSAAVILSALVVPLAAEEFNMNVKAAPSAILEGRALVKLERMRAYVLDQLGGQPDEPLTPQMAAAIPPALKGQARSLAQGIEKACPGSPIAAKAAAIAAEFAQTP